jgi:hypothetical protein
VAAAATTSRRSRSVVGQRLTIVNQPQVPTRRESGGKVDRVDATHGSFDNNIDVVDATLRLITGAAKLPLPVDDLRGF